MKITVTSTGAKSQKLLTLLSVAYINNGGSANIPLDVCENKVLILFLNQISQILWILFVVKVLNLGK